MHRVFYLSASLGFQTARSLNEILGVAREKNGVDGITGLLLYDEGSFAQVLEGPEPALRACFERIKQDQRHMGCKVIIDEPAPTRLFKDCPMGFIPSAKMVPAQYGDLLKDQHTNIETLYHAVHGHPLIRSFISGFDLAPRRTALRATA